MHPLRSAHARGGSHRVHSCASAPADGPSHCPVCSGTNFKKFSLVFEEQRSTGAARSSTVGAGIASGGGLGVGGAATTTKSEQLTDLARRVAPPVDKNPLAPWAALGGILVGGLSWMVSGPLAGFIMSAMGVVFFALLLHGKYGGKIKADNETAFREWDGKFLCLQCGAALVRDPKGDLLKAS